MSAMQPGFRSLLVKKIAGELGFQYCGISKAEFLAEEAPRLEQWLKNGMHGKMQYMENHFDKRLDPTLLVPGAKSVISLLYNYHAEKKEQPAGAPRIASYAYGEDYHQVIKEKLFAFVDLINEKIGAVQGRVFVDSAPVMERSWAARSGAGWIGRHTLLIRKGVGSFSFIAELILDLELESDGPVKDYCGTCTACVDACPTDAITPYGVNASQCISYLTIELKEEIPSVFKDRMDNWVFGCDICQEVCPWNRFATQHQEPAFSPQNGLLEMDKEEWHEMTAAVFGRLFKKSAVKRTGYKGLKRNLEFISPT